MSRETSALGDGLYSRIECRQLQFLERFRPPKGNETPTHRYELPLVVRSHNRVDGRGRADVVTRSGVHRRLVQRESVQRNDFFPRQLIGGAPAHARQHIASLDECATLRPNCRSCANWDHGQRSVSYSERRLGYGCGVSAASITGRLLARLLSSCGGHAGARCTSCGGKGATLQRPGWAGNNVGFYPFPTEPADRGD